MKTLLSLVITVSLVLSYTQGFAQQASGQIVFGKNEKDLIPCTKQGICKVSNTTNDIDGSMIKFNASPIKNSSDSFSVTFTINLDTLRKYQEEQYGYFTNTLKSYLFESSFIFPTWLMDSLEWSEFEPIVLKNGWSLGRPPRANDKNEITMILCGFVKTPTTSDERVKVSNAKKTGKVLSVNEVKNAIKRK